jgi:Neuraminidase (sialidase)
MRFRTCIETCVSIMILSGICLSDDTAFISMTGDCRYPAIATEGKSIFMTWLVSEGKNAQLYFRRSSDEGLNWTSARKMSNDNGDVFPPAIAVNSGIVHLAWIDYGETVDGELYYARSLDGGETWGKNLILVKDANSARYPLLAGRENNVYLIWQDVENKVYFKASYDQGKTWKDQVLLGKVGKHSCYCYPPAISCSGKELTVVWSDFRDDKKGLKVLFDGLSLFKSGDKMISSVVCRRSTDNGRTWNMEQVLSATPLSKETKEEIDNPIMVSDGSLSYLFWLDRRNLVLGEIFYSRFDPKTAKFPIDGKNVYPTEKRSPKRPSVVFDKEGNLHFTWASFFNGESIVYYGEIDPAGNVLKEKKELTTNPGHYYNPILARTSSGLLHVFWFDQPKEDKTEWSRIFFKTSKDNGVTWENWEPQKKD